MTWVSVAFRKLFGRPTKTRKFLMLLAALSVPVATAALVIGWWQVSVVMAIAIQSLVLVTVLDMRARMATASTLGKATQASGRNEAQLRDLESKLASAFERQRIELRTRFDDVNAQVQKFESRVGKLLPHQTQQIEALIQLYGRVDPKVAMPLAGRSAVDAIDLLALADLIHERRPQTILELGSGTSSVWIGHVVRSLGSGHLVTIDHDERYAKETSQQIEGHELGPYVDVRTAGLVDCSIEGHAAPWYDHAQFADVVDVDLLLVDGPPKAVGKCSRFPALPILHRQLAPAAIILLDDADRPDEKAILERWKADHMGVESMETRFSSTMRALLLN